MPEVSIVMPIRNETEHIERSLRSVLNQDYPQDAVEILIVDGMSDDCTREIVRTEIRRHSDRRILLLDNPDRVVPTAINKALRQASGSIIIRVDGHCELAPDYVRRCVELLEKTGADNVGGRQEARGDGLVARTIALATSSPFGVGNASFHYADEPGWADTVYLGAWPRKVFERIGGFDEELVRNQDDEFNFRLLQAGGKIWFDPSIRSIYYNRTSFRKLWRQYFQYGFYKVRVIQKRRAVPSWRHLVPAGFVMGVGLSTALSIATGSSLPVVLVLGPYLAANLVASILSAGKELRSLPILPIVFTILHVAYGSGFLSGLWHWRRTWQKEAIDAPVILEKTKIR